MPVARHLREEHRSRGPTRPTRHGEGITVSPLALAWLLAQGEDIVPIPGTRSAARMDENGHTADVALTEADLAAIHEIHEILPTGGFGARYAEERVPDWV